MRAAFREAAWRRINADAWSRSTSDDKNMVSWTAVVAVFAVVLAIVSIVQGAFVLWQASTAASCGRRGVRANCDSRCDCRGRHTARSVASHCL